MHYTCIIRTHKKILAIYPIHEYQVILHTMAPYLYNRECIERALIMSRINSAIISQCELYKHTYCCC